MGDIIRNTEFVDWLGEQRPFYGNFIAATAFASPSPTPTPSITASNTPTPSITPTNTITPTKTTTPTPSITPPPICPNEFIVSGSTSGLFDNGTYLRRYVISGDSIDYGYAVRITATSGYIVKGLAPDGEKYTLWQLPNGDINSVIMAFDPSNVRQGWMAQEQTPNLLASGTTWIGNSTIISADRILNDGYYYPPRGAVSGGVITYPLSCPTPTPTNSNTPTPTNTSTPTRTPTNTPTPSNNAVCNFEIVETNATEPDFNGTYNYFGIGYWDRDNDIIVLGTYLGNSYIIYREGATNNYIIWSPDFATAWQNVNTGTEDTEALNNQTITIGGINYPKAGTTSSGAILTYPSVCTTLTPTPTITASQTQTPTPSITASKTPTPTTTTTLTTTPSQTPTLTKTPTNTPTPSLTPGLPKWVASLQSDSGCGSDPLTAYTGNKLFVNNVEYPFQNTSNSAIQEACITNLPLPLSVGQSLEVRIEITDALELCEVGGGEFYNKFIWTVTSIPSPGTYDCNLAVVNGSTTGSTLTDTLSNGTATYFNCPVNFVSSSFNAPYFFVRPVNP